MTYLLAGAAVRVCWCASITKADLPIGSGPVAAVGIGVIHTRRGRRNSARLYWGKEGKEGKKEG